MAEPQPDIEREIEIETAKRAAARGGGDAVHDAVKGVVGSVYGFGSSVASGIVDGITADLGIPSEPPAKPGESWWVRKRRQIDAAVADVANTKVPLKWRALWYILKKIVAYLKWAGSTYPHILRPVRMLAGWVRRRLDAKIARQGTATNWQKLRRRLYSIGPTYGLLARLRYSFINTVTVFFVLSTLTVALIDGGYSYGTHEVYRGVKITNIFRSPDMENHSNEVHGYAADARGRRHDLYFDTRWSPFYLIFFPQYVVSDMSIGDVCDLSTWGTSTRIPVSLRRLLSSNPHIISAACHASDQTK